MFKQQTDDVPQFFRTSPGFQGECTLHIVMSHSRGPRGRSGDPFPLAFWIRQIQQVQEMVKAMIYSLQESGKSLPFTPPSPPKHEPLNLAQQRCHGQRPVHDLLQHPQ